MSITPADLNGHGATGPARELSGRRLQATSMADVSPQCVRWLWKDRLPVGMVSIIAGEPGLGKSTLTAEVAARTSRGELDGDLRGRACDVLIVTYEDHIASVVRPRLEAAQADLGRVHYLEAVEEDGSEGLISLPGDVDGIAREVERTASGLLIVDPVVAALAGEVNSHKDQDVRRALAPLAKLAERLGVAVIAVMHVNKSRANSLFQRIGGSVAFTGAARSVLLVARDPDDPDRERGYRRVLAHGKSNAGQYARSLRFEIASKHVGDSDGIPTSRIEWLGECDTTSADLLSIADGDPERPGRDHACAFLRAELADGPRKANDVKNEAGRIGISPRTLERAKADVGVICKLLGGVGTPWFWSLPEAANPAGGVDDSDPLAASREPASVSGETTIENALGPRERQSHLFGALGATGGRGASPQTAGHSAQPDGPGPGDDRNRRLDGCHEA